MRESLKTVRGWGWGLQEESILCLIWDLVSSCSKQQGKWEPVRSDKVNHVQEEDSEGCCLKLLGIEEGYWHVCSWI